MRILEYIFEKKMGFAIQLIYFSGEDQVQSYWMAQPLSGRKTAGKTVQSEPPELKPIKKSLRGFLVSRRSNSVERWPYPFTSLNRTTSRHAVSREYVKCGLTRRCRARVSSTRRVAGRGTAQWRHRARRTCVQTGALAQYSAGPRALFAERRVKRSSRKTCGSSLNV